MKKTLQLILILLTVSQSIEAQKASLWAGSTTAGYTNNGTTTSNVKFTNPYGMAYDADGNLWISQEGSHVITMYQASDSKFYVRAGKLGTSGYSNSGGVNAQFSKPAGIAVGKAIYIADQGNHVIRKMDLFTAMSTQQQVGLLAGKQGSSGGYKDGTGSAAEFKNPTDVAIDSKGNIYVADQGNHVIRMITPSGVVTTFAGQAGKTGKTNGDKDTKALFNYPTGIFIDANDNVYIADKSNSVIRKITASTGVVSTVLTDLYAPDDVFVDAYGTIYASNSCQLVVFNPSLPSDTMFIGNHPRNCGYKNASDTNALLNGSRAFVPLATNTYLVSDNGNNMIREIEVDPCNKVKAVINAKSSTEFCQGSSVDLEATGNFTFKWTLPNNTSLTSSKITANTQGRYKLKVQDGFGFCSDTTSVFVKVNPIPTPNLVASGSIQFCPGDSVELSTATTYSKYTWTGISASRKSIFVKNTGAYSVEVVDANGCIGQSNTMIINVYNTIDPIISANGTTEFCLGDSVELEASDGYKDYNWSTSEIGKSIYIKTSGKVNVSATDNNGCYVESEDIDIIVNPLPNKPVLTENGGKITCSETADQYIWYIDGKEENSFTTKEIKAGISGMYKVKIIDANGCSIESDEIQVVISSFHQNQTNTVAIYPIPFNDYININGLENNSLIQIFDITGKLLAQYEDQKQINTTDLQSGIYFIKISNSNNIQTIRAIKAD